MRFEYLEDNNKKKEQNMKKEAVGDIELQDDILIVVKEFIKCTVTI